MTTGNGHRPILPWCPYCMAEVSLYGSDHVVVDDGDDPILTECNVYGRTL